MGLTRLLSLWNKFTIPSSDSSVRSVIILAVHSTSTLQSLALMAGDRLVLEQTLPHMRRHVEHLAPAIKEIVKELDHGLADVNVFAVAIGPGSFSGIRVGIATVKGLALVLGKPVVGISSLDALAWQGLHSGETGAPVIDARRGQVYTAVYRREPERLVMLSEPVLMSAGECGSLAAVARSRKLIVCGDPVVEDLAARSTALVARPIQHPPAVACAELARIRFYAGKVDALHALAPLYIRRSDAEEKSSARHVLSPLK